MASDRYNWPADFPADCPPAAALAADGIYYYIVKTDSPQIEEFAPLHRRDRERADKAVRNGRATRCETMGLSSYANLDDALACRTAFPRIGSRIALLTLAPDAGKILPTPRVINGVEDSHCTWWHPADYDPTAAVTVVLPL